MQTHILSRIQAMLSIIAALCFSHGAAAAPGVVAIGVQAFEDYSPYSLYKNDQYSGFNRDLLDAFAREYKHEFDYQPMPIKRLYHHFLRGEIDLKYPDNPAWSKSQKEGFDIIYSQPVVSFIDGVVVLKENLSKPLPWLKRIGMISGYTPKPYLDDISKGKIRIMEAKEMDSLIKQLVTGRVNGIYVNIAVLNSHVKNSAEAFPKMVFNPSLPYLRDSRYLSTKDSPYLILEFNNFMKENAGTIADLKNRYDLLDADDILTGTSKQPILAR